MTNRSTVWRDAKWLIEDIWRPDHEMTDQQVESLADLVEHRFDSTSYFDQMDMIISRELNGTPAPLAPGNRASMTTQDVLTSAQALAKCNYDKECDDARQQIEDRTFDEWAQHIEAHHVYWHVLTVIHQGSHAAVIEDLRADYVASQADPS